MIIMVKKGLMTLVIFLVFAAAALAISYPPYLYDGAPDADADGLDDDQETAGWVAEYYDCSNNLVRRFVFSSILSSNADADCVIDLNERLWDLDPAAFDMDLDNSQDSTSACWKAYVSDDGCHSHCNNFLFCDPLTLEQWIILIDHYIAWMNTKSCESNGIYYNMTEYKPSYPAAGQFTYVFNVTNNQNCPLKYFSIPLPDGVGIIEPSGNYISSVTGNTYSITPNNDVRFTYTSGTEIKDGLTEEFNITIDTDLGENFTQLYAATFESEACSKSICKIDFLILDYMFKISQLSSVQFLLGGTYAITTVEDIQTYFLTAPDNVKQLLTLWLNVVSKRICYIQPIVVDCALTAITPFPGTVEDMIGFAELNIGLAGLDDDLAFINEGVQSCITCTSPQTSPAPVSPGPSGGGSTCPDGSCNFGETCKSCSKDCGECEDEEEERKDQLIITVIETGVSKDPVIITVFITKDGDQENIDDATVYITKDSEQIETGVTDPNGQVTFNLPPGTYRAYADKSDYDLSTPREFTLVAPVEVEEPSVLLSFGTSAMLMLLVAIAVLLGYFLFKVAKPIWYPSAGADILLIGDKHLGKTATKAISYASGSILGFGLNVQSNTGFMNYKKGKDEGLTINDLLSAKWINLIGTNQQALESLKQKITNSLNEEEKKKIGKMSIWTVKGPINHDTAKQHLDQQFAQNPDLKNKFRK